MRKTRKCIVVLSGGLDSTTVAYWAKNQNYKVYALCFDYSQLAKKEIFCAKNIAKELNVQIKIVNLSSLKEIFMGTTSLCDEKIPLTSDFSDPIIVPFRNGIFLSVAVAYAVSLGAEFIFYGAQGSDRTFYPDCRKEFYLSFEKTAQLGTCKKIKIDAPFADQNKSELLRIAMKLGVPFDLTWSCYRSGEKHCGNCEACINRKKAFREAGLVDVTEYLMG